MWAFGVAWYGNVDKSQRRISVAEGNHWNVDVAGLGDWLMVGGWVSHHEETGLAKSSLVKTDKSSLMRLLGFQPTFFLHRVFSHLPSCLQ